MTEPRRSYAILDPLTGKLPIEAVPDEILASDPAPGGAHPDLAEHQAIGLAPAHPHPYEPMGTVATHAQTAHGLSSHAIDGAFHSGAGVLPTQGQKNALAGTSGTPGTGNEFVTTQDPRNTNARTPVAHSHLDADIPAGIARDAEVASTYALIHSHPYEPSGAVAAHAGLADPHPGYLTPAEGSAAYSPVGHTHPGGGSAWTTVFKASDESKNATAVVADDPVLQFPTVANTAYHVRIRAFFLTNATADLKYRLVHTGTTTRVRRRVYRTATTDVAQTVELKTAFDAADVVLSTTGLNPWLEEDVVLQVGASPGVFKLQWAQVTSGPGPTTCLEGSYLEYAIT